MVEFERMWVTALYLCLMTEIYTGLGLRRLPFLESAPVDIS